MMASFDFASLALRYAQDERGNVPKPFVLSVAERQRSEVEGRHWPLAEEPLHHDRPTAGIGLAMSFARSVLDGADLVVSATTTSEPFVKQEWISPGAFVYSIGKHQELESAAYKAMGKFVVDSWAQCKKKSDIDRMLREGFLTPEDVHAELPDILTGKVPGREDDRERIFMRAIGLVNQDISLAAWLYQKALEQGAGTRLPY